MKLVSIDLRLKMRASKLDLCLDFSNTVDWRNGSKKQDNLSSYDDLVQWGRTKGLLSDAMAINLEKTTDRLSADVALKKAHSLREATYRIFSSVAHGSVPPEDELRTLNSFLASTMRKSGIEMEGGSFNWSWRGGTDSPERIFWQIAKSAADLLTSDKLGMLRECSNERDGCAWLFLDTTKNHTRKWCSMDTCGNRTKFRVYYEKHSLA
jgi:predicted RNA-binding Zn ribbon-like protein